MLLTKNNGYFTKLDKRIISLDSTAHLKEGWQFAVDQGFEEASDVFELVEGLHNLLAVMTVLRPFEYSTQAMLRAMHRCREMSLNYEMNN